MFSPVPFIYSAIGAKKSLLSKFLAEKGFIKSQY